MKFTCLQENLIRGLNIVSRVCGKNVSLPILNNILISVKNEGINFMATNLEIGIKMDVRGKTETEGQITVPAKILTSFVNYLPEEKVEFELSESDLKIVSGSWQTKIKTQNAEEYPLIPEVLDKNSLKVKLGKLKVLLNQTIFAAIGNEARPELSGGYFLINGKQLTVVATDSYRLAEKKIELEEDTKKETSFIVPIKTLQEVARIINDLDEDKNLEIFWEENQIKFVVDGIELSSRLIDGDYPDYQQIIPQTFKTKISFVKAEVINAVRATGLFSKTGIYDVGFDFVTPDKIIIKSTNNQVGENEAVIKADVAGDSEKIIFNYHYILEGLVNMAGEKMVFEITTGENPAILRAEDKDDYLYLIMPIRQ